MNEQIAELNENFNGLGEDLVLLEAVLQTRYDFPPEAVASSLARIADYIEQHTGELRYLARCLTAS